MEAFPFSDEDWAVISDAAKNIVLATFAEQPIIHEWNVRSLLDVLQQLRGKYGEHPALLETEADFVDDEIERIGLYRRAIDLAESNDIQTLTIRLSLAQLLIDIGQSALAHEELRACADELPGGDKYDEENWKQLFEESKPSE